MSQPQEDLNRQVNKIATSLQLIALCAAAEQIRTEIFALEEEEADKSSSEFGEMQFSDTGEIDHPDRKELREGVSMLIGIQENILEALILKIKDIEDGDK